MAAGLYQCPAVQSRARPADRSGSHYRNGFGVVSLSQNLAEETQRVIHGGAPFHSASASPMGYAPAERNSVLSTLTSLGVGQIKPPKWARPTCQKHFSLPMFIHSQVPPGVPVMKEKRSAISYTLEELPDGGRVRIRTGD